MNLSPDDINALLLTIKLSSVTTIILLGLGLPFSWWLATSKWRFKFIIEAGIAMPLVLPPTVLGFYLLTLLNPNGYIGKVVTFMGGPNLVFSFWGLVIGSIIYSAPFVIGPLRDTFSAIGKAPLEAASTLAASPFDAFLSVILPLARPGIITASVLGFAHTLGEFGVVLMIGGNIPGETKVLSIAIYDHVEQLNYTAAHSLSAILVTFSLILLICVYGFNKRFKAV